MREWTRSVVTQAISEMSSGDIVLMTRETYGVTLLVRGLAKLRGVGVVEFLPNGRRFCDGRAAAMWSDKFREHNALPWRLKAAVMSRAIVNVALRSRAESGREPSMLAVVAPWNPGTDMVGLCDIAKSAGIHVAAVACPSTLAPARVLPFFGSVEAPGFVYFIAASDGLVKIGWSNDPRRRLDDLSIARGDELRLVVYAAGSMHLERYLHAAFTDLRVRGEWFRQGVRLVRLMRRLLRASQSGVPTTAMVLAILDESGRAVSNAS